MQEPLLNSRSTSCSLELCCDPLLLLLHSQQLLLHVQVCRELILRKLHTRLLRTSMRKWRCRSSSLRLLRLLLLPLLHPQSQQRLLLAPLLLLLQGHRLPSGKKLPSSGQAMQGLMSQRRYEAFPTLICGNAEAVRELRQHSTAKESPA